MTIAELQKIYNNEGTQSEVILMQLYVFYNNYFINNQKVILLLLLLSITYVQL